jgi:hypothetical protein
MNANHLIAGVSSWIINDGNHQNFKRGDETAFAVQFYAPSPLTLVEDGQPVLQESIDRNRYRILSRVSHVFSDWWVIEINGFQCFTQQRAPLDVQPGRCVGGEIVLTVDPYFYVEHLSRRPDAPALIYQWKIRKIEIQTAPYITEGRGRVRDQARLGWRAIDETHAAVDDGGLAEYVLHCDRANESPKLIRS